MFGKGLACVLFLLQCLKRKVGTSQDSSFWITVPDMGSGLVSSVRALIVDPPWEPAAFKTSLSVTRKHQQEESKLCASCH